MPKDITVTLPSGASFRTPFGTVIRDVVPRLGPSHHPIVACYVNNELRSLGATLFVNSDIRPVTVDMADGMLVYRRSLCFLLACAADQVFPGRRLVVGQAIGYGFYFGFEDDAPVEAADVDMLEKRMSDLVKQDIPINIEYFSYQDALEHFRAHGQNYTLMLLEHMNDSRIPLVECGGFLDLNVAPLVPSTGALKTFDLMGYGTGFLLRFPATSDPGALPEHKDEPLLFDIYKEYKSRGRILGVPSVGALNHLSAPKEMKSFVQIVETFQNKKIAEIADRIKERPDVKCVLIAGPSSSGKTTTSKKLAIQLRVLGYTPIVIELDSYFLDNAKTPRDENGQPDFECLEALDVEFLNQQLLSLFSGDEIELPTFDFKAGVRKNSGVKLKMRGNEILVLEGIHGLNDRLTPKIPREQKFKVYVSALTALNLDDHNRISTTDNRLLRRMVRDYQFRGHSAQATLKMWPSVQRGERKHIFPFQNSADAAFNSALDYELGVLKTFAEPLLRTVKPTQVEYAEARRLQSFLENFSPIPSQMVPSDSILREFIGGSDFKY
jgi:uridine kinase